jgi:hypothetical protein
MSEKKKEVFKVNDTEYAVLKPMPKDQRAAQRVYNATFAEALKAGGLLRQRLGDYMRDQGLWNDEKEKQQRELLNNLNEHELNLQRGGIKLSEARRLALDIRKVRFQLRNLIAQRNELDVNTVEGQAENARFNALVASCLVYNDTGKPVYSDVDDYLTNADTEEAFTGAQTLAQMMYALDKNHEASLPENKFLSKWRFVDEELRLVNKDGHLVDTEGRLINDKGHYVDEQGNLVDVNGNPVDEIGNYQVESQPFLDDDGQPLPDPE